MKGRRRKNPNTETWVRRIYGLKFQIPVGKRYLGTGKVRDFCIRQQFLPAAAAEIPLRTLYRVAQELKLSPWETGLGGVGRKQGAGARDQGPVGEKDPSSLET